MFSYYLVIWESGNGVHANFLVFVLVPNLLSRHIPRTRILYHEIVMKKYVISVVQAWHIAETRKYKARSADFPPRCAILVQGVG